jgi:hypothetical protein
VLCGSERFDRTLTACVGLPWVLCRKWPWEICCVLRVGLFCSGDGLDLSA